MALSWVEVVDTALKIGLGSLIAAVAGYYTLKRVNQYDEQKELKRHFYKLQDDKKVAYINFLSLSQNLVQSHIWKSCTCDTDEYKEYLMAYNVVQVLSDDAVRLQANQLFDAVNQFIVANKSSELNDFHQELRKVFDQKLSLFQKVAQLEVNAVYSSS